MGWTGGLEQAGPLWLALLAVSWDRDSEAREVIYLQT